MSGDSVVYEGLDEAGTARAGQVPLAVSAAIEVSHLTKVFGGRTAVSDVSFSVAGGEIFGFLGPNGAGKTTTVRTLGTLIAPSSGSAIVTGIPLNAKNGPAIRSRISIMPESPGLYLRLTVLENLECFAGLAVDLLAWRVVTTMFDRGTARDRQTWMTVAATWRRSPSTQRNRRSKGGDQQCPQR